MAGLLTYLLVLAAGPVASDAAGQALLQRARTAQRSGDDAAVRRFLRGWASLRAREKLPSDLEAEAARAVSFVEENGLLRVYGSWRDGVVRVGVRDPAQIVDHVNVWAVDGDGRRSRLVQIRRAPDGSLIYRVDEDVADAVAIEAVMLGDREVVLASTMLRRIEAALPDPPDPQALPRKLVQEPPPAEARREPSAVLSWWWVVAGLAAAALTGLAVVEERR